LGDFETHRQDLEAMGIKVIAASVDPLDKAKDIADTLSYPVGYEVTRETADRLGSYWEDRRGIIQPSEFLIDSDGVIKACSYSDGPIGRIDPRDVMKVVTFMESQKK
jgi:alkyl hydroperoxide reductase subunit AhpC